jgi:hypothetical protein
VLWLLGILCCFPLVGYRRSRGKISVGRWMQMADPTGNLRNLLQENDFAVTRTWKSQAKYAASKLKPSQLVMRWRPPSDNAVNLATFEGSLAGDVETALKSAKVKPIVVEVSTPDELPINRLGAIPVVEPNTRVRTFVYRGRVIGFAPARPEDG